MKHTHEEIMIVENLSRNWPRWYVKLRLGLTEAKLQELIIRGDLRPNPDTGTFARVKVEEYEQIIEEKTIYGNVGQSKKVLEGIDRDWGTAHLPLCATNTGRTGT